MKNKHKITGHSCAFGAFSLVEILVALIVISCIVAAFAPVMTKKLKTQLDLAGGGYDGVLFTYNENDPACTKLNDDDNYVICDFKVPDGVNQMNAILVSGGGGGGGAQYASGYQTVTKKVEGANASGTVNIVEGMRNVKIKFLTGGGGGGAGGVNIKQLWPLTQSDCDIYDARFFPSGTFESFASCITRYNLGDSSKTPITAGTTVLTPATLATFTPGTNQQICLQGTTSSSGKCNNNSGYDGCTRTVCNDYAIKNAADTLEANTGYYWFPLGFGLHSNFSNFNKAFNEAKTDVKKQALFDRKYKGIDLCINDASTQLFMSRCYPLWSSSGNTINDFWVFPEYILEWEVGYPATGGKYPVFSPSFYYSITHVESFAARFPSHNITRNKFLTSGRFYISSFLNFDKSKNNSSVLYTPRIFLSGGGGAAAPYIGGYETTDYKISQDVIDANIGGTISLSTGAGGKGGTNKEYTSPSTIPDMSSTKGEDGGESSIVIKNKNGTIKWGVKTQGGEGGIAATKKEDESTYWAPEFVASKGGIGNMQTEGLKKGCSINTGSGWSAYDKSYCSYYLLNYGDGNASDGQIYDMKTTGIPTSTTSLSGKLGGSGGGSIYNQMRNAAGGGYNYDGYNGSFGRKGASLAGAGGYGGTVTYFVSSKTFVTDPGGNGADGVAEISYEVPIDVYSGGGGGGGLGYKFESFPVNPETTLQLKVGGGGKGGAAGTSRYNEQDGKNGTDGETTELKINNTNLAVRIYPGTGGKGGTATNFGTAGGPHPQSYQAQNISNTLMKKLTQIGTSSRYGTDGSANVGGKGGLVSFGGIGGCGGANNTNGCNNSKADGLSATVAYPSSAAAIAKRHEYGSAGAGGGGGGFDTINGSGKGGDGQPGYVYLYWKKPKN